MRRRAVPELASLILLLLLLAASCAGARTGGSDPAITSLLSPEARGSTATVLAFVAPDCPISNAYAPELERIHREYAPRGVGFCLVYVGEGTSRETAALHAALYGYSCPISVDASRELVRRTGAAVTPEVAVVSADGDILYLGRIDDRYPELGVARTVPSTRDLRDALDAVIGGRAVPVARTRAVGCFIADGAE